MTRIRRIRKLAAALVPMIGLLMATGASANWR
jgi:hypothetical protein